MSRLPAGFPVAVAGLLDLQQFLFLGEVVEGQFDVLEASGDATGDRRGGAIENVVNGDTEHAAVLSGQFFFAPRQGILVSSAAGKEQRRGAGMTALEVELCEPGVVTAPHVVAHDSVVAGVPEDDGSKGAAVGRRDPQHGDIVIVGADPPGRSAVGGELAVAIAEGDCGGLEVLDGGTNEGDQLRVERLLVATDLFPVVVLHVEHVAEHPVECRATVCV